MANHALSLVSINIHTFLVAHQFEPQVMEPTNSGSKRNRSWKMWRQMAWWKEVIVYPFTEWFSRHVWLPLHKSVFTNPLCSLVIQGFVVMNTVSLVLPLQLDWEVAFIRKKIIAVAANGLFFKPHNRPCLSWTVSGIQNTPLSRYGCRSWETMCIYFPTSFSVAFPGRAPRDCPWESIEWGHPLHLCPQGMTDTWRDPLLMILSVLRGWCSV